MLPLASIIIPTYNRTHLIGETLESVLAQAYTNWECIVVDDRSTDYTDELMEFYCERDSRIHYYRRPNDRPKGANACRNYGFEKSKGEYIQWLDSDDLLDKEKIGLQIKELIKTGENMTFCSWMSYKNIKKPKYEPFKPKNKKFSCFEFFEKLGNFGGFLPPHVYLTKREMLEKGGMWNEYLTINQDGEFFNRLILCLSNIRHSDGIVIYRMDDDYSKISQYDSLDKVKDLIWSWKLIEGYHKVKFKNEKESDYLRFAKNYLYKALKPQYNNLIKRNSDFFSEQLKNDAKNNIFLRIFKHLSQTIKL